LALLLPGGRPVPSVAANADNEGLALLLIGSDHAVTAAQVEYLAAHGGNATSYELYRVFPDLPSGLIARAESLRRGGLFLCGGDTAAAVCRLLGAEAIHLLREVQPGIPLGRIRGGAAHGLAVITKSGGFGQPDAMAGIVGVLSAQERES
jgi:uncharacterized protein YgbK (DUF1537 family)